MGVRVEGELSFSSASIEGEESRCVRHVTHKSCITNHEPRPHKRENHPFRHPFHLFTTALPLLKDPPVPILAGIALFFEMSTSHTTL